MEQHENKHETEQANDAIIVKGVFRLQIVEDQKGGLPQFVVGDSGWCNNVVTVEGKRNYLARLLGALAGSSQIGFANVGTGAAPATNATTLPGEVTGTDSQVQRAAVTAATSGSTAVQFTFTLSSANSFVTQTENISNVGLWAISTGGTLFAGNTYASSSCATNQNVNGTYTISFS